MENFKKNWQIQKNWQLLFPILGIIILAYSSYKLSALIIGTNPFLIAAIAIVIFYLLLQITLVLFKKLERKWILNYKWEMIRVFIVFAITGSSSVFVGRPFIGLLGITKDNFPAAVYWILYIFIGLLFYQFLLVFYGWLFGQFRFFWEFEKKMLKRLGFRNLK